LGIAPDDIDYTGEIKRFGNKDECWYVLHIDGLPAGAYGNWKTAESYRWNAGGLLNPQDAQDYARQRKQNVLIQQLIRTQKHDDAAQKANTIWNHCQPAPHHHTYLKTKSIQPHSARLGRDNRLVIPLYNAHGELVNLQFISSDGDKRFLSGGLKKGCFHVIGSGTETLLICEGFATGASLYEDTELTVVVAFDAGNLKPVALAIRDVYPEADIIICGDNDMSGVGQSKAVEAAMSVGGRYLIPEQPGDDFNDFITREKDARAYNEPDAKKPAEHWL
jgi:putative DNA primase/helicase